MGNIKTNEMTEKEELYKLQEMYSNRINQLENWRHLQVVFVYTFLVPAFAFLTLGKDFIATNSVTLYYFLFLVVPITTLCSLFDIWSQKRVLILARALNEIELNPLVIKLKNKYWKLDKKRAKLYLWITQFSILIQFIIEFYILNRIYLIDKTINIYSLISIIILNLLELFIAYRLLRAEIKKI